MRRWRGNDDNLNNVSPCHIMWILIIICRREKQAKQFNLPHSPLEYLLHLGPWASVIIWECLLSSGSGCSFPCSGGDDIVDSLSHLDL